MQFLKILFWCLLAFLAAVFTVGNWTSIPIRLPGGLIAEVNLPLLLFATFLVGWAPTHLYHLVRRWRLRQRLATSERRLGEVRAVVVPPPPPPVAAAAMEPAAPGPAALPPAAPPLLPDEPRP
jgi:lipopolysaccharide assembly protein A